VILDRRRVGPLREDEDLVLDCRLELRESLVDRVSVSQHFDVLERVAVLPAGQKGRCQVLDHLVRVALEVGEVAAVLLDEALERPLGRRRGVLDRAARPSRGESLLDKA
jgi:hypothetical protein